MSGKYWRIIFFILGVFVFISLACNFTAPKPIQNLIASPTPNIPLPPMIVETAPAMGSEIPLAQPITFYFNQPMDHTSVEASLSFPIRGSVMWSDDATMIFIPAEPLTAGTRYQFIIATSAKAANGLAFTQPASVDFRSAPNPQLTQFLPEADMQDVAPNAAVVASFNQPMVPLGGGDDPSRLPAAFTLEPAVSGKGEWINTSTYLFRPETAYAGGTTYTATLNNQLTSLAGAALLQQPSWSFTTTLPRIVSFTPTEEAWNLDQVVEIVFNQPMDRASVESAFVFAVSSGARVPGIFKWDARGETLTFTPNELLARDTIYSYALTDAARGLGGARLQNPFNSTIKTYPNFAFAGTDIESAARQAPRMPDVYFTTIMAGGGRGFSGSRTINFFFTAPVQEGLLDDFVTISPEPPSSYVGNYESPTQLTVSAYALEPVTTYTVTISGELADRWGQKLGRDVTVTFTTPDAEPSAQLPFYFRSAYTVRPDAPGIYLQATNISAFEIYTASLPLSDFFRLTGPNGYDLQNTYQAAGLVSWQVAGNTTINKNELLTMPLTQDGSPLVTGVYYLWLSSAGYMITPTNQQNIDNPNFFIASNIDVTLKVGAADALVWAVDGRTQKPLIGSPVTLYDKNGAALANGTTDTNGIWYTGITPQNEQSGPFFAVISQPGADDFALAMSSWDDGVAPWNFDVPADYRGAHPELYLYSDRPIYRPGQTVYLRGAVRDLFDARYNIPALKEIELIINTSSGGDSPTTMVLPISEYGTFNAEYAIPEDAQPGAFSVTAEGYPLYFSFQVADYRKPEINLAVELSPENLKLGEALHATLNAQYFFGVPVGNMDVEWHLYRDSAYFYLPGYLVGGCKDASLNCYYGEGYTGYYGEAVASGTATTGADGLAEVQFDEDALAYINQTSGHYTLEAIAQDESGFPVSARTAVTIHPESYYIGVRPDSWVGQARTPMNFTLYTSGWDQAPSGSHNVDVEFDQVKWQKKDSGFGYYYYTPLATKIDSASVTTDGDGKARVSFTPKTGGTYLLKLTSGNAFTSMLVWVGGAESAQWPSISDQQIRLVSDQTSYKPGQTAQVYVPNPFGYDAPTLITMERGKIRSSLTFTLAKGGATIPVTLSDIDAPNVYVSATVLGKDSDFRVGYINLEVAADAQKLKVELTSQPERSEPGGDVMFSVRVTDSTGRPAQGEFSFAVVDLAALALADPNSPDIFPAFYNIQPLNIRSGFTSAVSATRGIQPPGGGGGGGGGDGAISVTRENFPDTAYWKADIVTDADGRATVSMKLPDNLTTWHIDVRGLTKDTRVGQATLDVVATKPLLIRPVTPRFFIAGDHVELAAVVNNTTAADVNATVALQAQGFTLDNPKEASQKVIVPANGRVRVAWLGTAQDAASAELIFSVEGGGMQDATKPTAGDLPILHYNAPQTFTTAGILSDAGSSLEVVSLPRSYAPTGGALNVELSPSLAGSLLSKLDVLELPEKTWGAEQIVSYFLPNLETYRTLQDSGLDDPKLKARLADTLTKSVDQLLGLQNTDGGWGWATGSESDYYITAYAMFGLMRARAADVTVSEVVMQNAYAYLQTAETNNSEQLPTRDDRRAFIEYVLQMNGGASAAALDQLYGYRDTLSPWAKALLALTLESASASDARAQELYSNLQTTAVRSASGVNWRSDLWYAPSPLFNTAVVVFALAQRDPAAPVVVDAVRYLATQSDAANNWWSSYYENTWVILALNQALKGSGDLQANFKFSATLNNVPLADGQAAAPQTLTPVTASVPLKGLSLTSPNALNIAREAGAGKLYYRAILNIERPVETAQPLSMGMQVTRAYFDASCTSDCKPLTAFDIQTTPKVRVRVTVTLANPGYYVSVQDFIPAGAEILNTALNTTERGEGSGTDVTVTFDPEDPFSDGWGWWFFDDPKIYDDHILWQSTYVPAGTYQLTYTLVPLQAGSFRVIPARAWLNNFPEVQGTSAGTIVEIK